MIDFLESIKTKITTDSNYNKAIKSGYRPLNKRQYAAYNNFRPQGAKPIFCYLPYNSLTFSFSGKVYVCSYNRDVILGEYPKNTIKEIWEGEKAQKLRRHMSHNDLEYGCRHCKFFFDKGKFSNIRPLVFDKYYKHTNADHPRVFEFEIDNKCNLECQMCNGEVSSSIRKNRDKLPPIPSPYDDNFVKQLEVYIPTLKEAKFYGGEPFMIPLYYKIWDKVKELNPNLELFVITNGTLWNSNIERLINELNFDIAISIDALDKNKLEKIRKNVVKETLLENINHFSEVCKRKNKHLSLSFTIQKENWDQLPAHIELCNKVDAYAYISYLENPKEYSILELPKHDIITIRNWLDNHSFPSETSKEKHNARCFQDYKNYLDAYLRNEKEARYNDYQFVPEWAEAGDSEILAKENHIVVKPNVTKEDVLNRCKSFLNNNIQYSNYDLEEIMNKLEIVLTYFSESEHSKIFGMIMKADIANSITVIKSKEVEELVKSTEEMLSIVVIDKE